MAAVMDRLIREGEGTTEDEWLGWSGLDRLPAVVADPTQGALLPV